MNHLVIYNKNLFAKDYIAQILNGNKTFGSKFTTRKTPPYQNLKDGDYLYLKESSGPVRGRIRVSDVVHKELLDPEEIMDFLVEHFHDIGIHSERRLMDIWARNANKRYLCYWTINSPETARQPVSIYKRDRRSWVSNYEPSENVKAVFL